MNVQDFVKRPLEAVSKLPADTSEDGLALAFAERFGDRLRFDHTRGRWFEYDDTRWREESTQLAFCWARDLCRAHSKGENKTQLKKIRTASAVEQAAKADRRLAVSHEVWNQDPWLLCTPGGTVDLRTGDIRPNDPADMITQTTAVEPEPLPTPTWDKFIADVTRGDDDLARLLQQYAGYALTGDTREHALMFIYGPGANGKTTFAETLSGILGDYAVTAPMETFTASKYSAHPTEIARLESARLVGASETESGRHWAESRIKSLTGGDRIAARYMRQDFFEFTPRFKLLFVGNHRPALHNVDEAARRRFLLVPFEFKPATKDYSLAEKLRQEWPGILQWAIGGCLDWQEYGLARPQVVTDATDDYFSAQDVFGAWLEECTERKSELTGETGADLFKSWKRYATDQDEDAGNQKSFAERMERRGYKRVKNTPGHHGKRGFSGIMLSPLDQPQDWQP